MKTTAFLMLLIATALTTGCARQLSSNVYSEDSVGEASETYPGVIIGVRTVSVEGGDSLGDNTLGIIGGGVAGALVGSTIGKGGGNTLATVAGGLLGATGGAYAEKALKSQQGMEYVVSLENGQTRTVVQGMEPHLSVGQNVYVMISHHGRSRVVTR
jgi:outer membrane lipoprotein SlyB